ncbi:hypothetical protein SHKM778_39290 [Streptomyces sp. KM77-8]|uniref:Uncharacterized protein n=1 Tax=Streptomyces haneummycinicus TaxID=3074435 RepID=A0AAT9HJ33_9ACTN
MTQRELNVESRRSGTGPGTTKGRDMSARTSHCEGDALPGETMDVMVIGGGATGLNGALRPPARAARPSRPTAAHPEMRDKPIGVLATGPASVRHAWPLRRLTDDLLCVTRDTDVESETRARFAAQSQARTEGPDGLKPPRKHLPDDTGHRFTCAMAGNPGRAGAPQRHRPHRPGRRSHCGPAPTTTPRRRPPADM